MEWTTIPQGAFLRSSGGVNGEALATSDHDNVGFKDTSSDPVFLTPEWMEDRLLQEGGNTTTSGTIAPTDMTEDPSFNDNTGGGSNVNDSILAENEGAVRFGIIFLAAASVVLAFVGWRSFRYWKLRRERHLLQVQSSRADAVLGDMQMIPNDDYDEDDPELL